MEELGLLVPGEGCNRVSPIQKSGMLKLCQPVMCERAKRILLLCLLFKNACYSFTYVGNRIGTESCPQML